MTQDAVNLAMGQYKKLMMIKELQDAKQGKSDVTTQALALGEWANKYHDEIMEAIDRQRAREAKLIYLWMRLRIFFVFVDSRCPPGIGGGFRQSFQELDNELVG